MKKTVSPPIVISLKDITKTYRLHHQKPTLSDFLLHRDYWETFTALDDLSLTIRQGEKVGIIGQNGSGKTTLLKIIAGISTPQHGEVKVKGNVISLLNLEAGFHIDLTGEENIFLNALLLGLQRKEIRRLLPAIIEFADIGRFLDAPLFTYSDGMKLRLGFAIAIHAHPDILILDEVMAVGDQNFQLKAQQKIDEHLASNTTILMVSHWLDLLRKSCKRIIWMEQGRIVRDGSMRVVEAYEAANRLSGFTQ